MENGPTTGAMERDPRAWQAWPGLALAIRVVAFGLPLIASIVFVRLVSGVFLRPEGWVGLVIWFVQAAPVGIAVSLLVDRFTRRLLPLAALFSMSLVFPDEAPSRFSVALRAGSINRLKQKVGKVKPIAEHTDPNEAAAHAIGLVSALGRHDRLTRGHTERVRAYADMIGEHDPAPILIEARRTVGLENLCDVVHVDAVTPMRIRVDLACSAEGTIYTRIQFLSLGETGALFVADDGGYETRFERC